MMKISLILKGMAMGIAEVIPGVSGGTIAFITGIYERLLDTIKSIDKTSIGYLLKFRFKDFWQRIDGNFLITLLAGMFIGILFGVFAITYLIEHYIEPLWGFFFGLIVASAIYIGKQVEKWDIYNVLFLILAIAGAYYLVAMQPLEGSRAYWYVFVAGMIAISALIMPGISGSFMLLILGMYTIIIPEVKNLITSFSFDGFSLLVVFGLGLLTGLFTFARVISWAFKNYRQKTLVVLTGFMIGSLYKIWPWRIPTKWLDKTDNTIHEGLQNIGNFSIDNIKVLSEKLVLPGDYSLSEPHTVLVFVFMAIGFLLVFLLEKYDNKTE